MSAGCFLADDDDGRKDVGMNSDQHEPVVLICEGKNRNIFEHLRVLLVIRNWIFDVCKSIFDA